MGLMIRFKRLFLLLTVIEKIKSCKKSFYYFDYERRVWFDRGDV